MPQVNGTITNLTTKSVTNKTTGKVSTLYYYEIDGALYNAGFRPSYKAGDTVNLNWSTSKFGENVIDGPALTAGSPGKFVGAGHSTAPNPSRKFPLDKMSPEMSIVRQSALKAAVDVYTNMVVAGIGETDETPADPEVLAEAIIRMAYKFADFSSGQREAKIVSGEK